MKKGTGLAGLLVIASLTVWAADSPKPSGDAPAVASPVKHSAVPTGMVSFFVGRNGCPDGWEVVPSVQGRMIVGVAKGGDAGITVGTPMQSRKAPVHSHDVTWAVILYVKQIAAANGGSNRNGAASGIHYGKATIEPSTDNLPFYEYLACRPQPEEVQ